jgi:hypothetical protein
MALITRTDQNAKAQVAGRRRDGEIVGGNETSAPAEEREQLGPALGDGCVEVHDSGDGDEGIDAFAALRGAFAAARQRDTDEEFAVHNGWDGDWFTGMVVERVLPSGGGALQRDEGARVDYESHGFRGGWSAAVTRSRSSAKEGSPPADFIQAATASRSGERTVSPVGPMRATATL